MRNTSEYFNKKIELLSDLLGCSEEIMSCINQDKWESYDELGEKRNAAIDTLNEFEKKYRQKFDPDLTPDQRQAINSKVQLILDFDRDVVKRLEEEKENALRGMSTEKNEDNIFNSYLVGTNQTTGVFLDTKR